MYKEYIPNKYNRFLKSEWWKTIRNRRFFKSGKICSACRSVKNLHIHHTSYELLYAGRLCKAVKYTCVLCRDCHYEFHNRFETKKDMREETNQFIEEKKAFIKDRKLEYEEWLDSIPYDFI